MATFSWVVIALLSFAIIFIWQRWLLRCKFCSKNKNQEKISPYSDQFVIAVSSTLCIVVVIIYFLIAHALPGLVEHVGEVGDFIGGLTNPLLSFAAFLVLLKTTTIQNSIVRKQLESQDLFAFREEFYSLRDNMLKISERMGRNDSHYIMDLYGKIKSARLELTSEFGSGPVYEEKAKRVIVDLIRDQDFSRFALSARRAMKHVLSQSPREIYDHAVVIRDSMTLRERTIFLNWIYYFWEREARLWFVGTWTDDGKWLNYEFTGGMTPGDLISDDVFIFFNKELPRKEK